MAKNTDTEQERIEQEFRNHINGIVKERTAKLQEQFGEAYAKAAQNAAKNRKRKLTREVAYCIFAVTGIAAVYMAEAAGLIAPVITGPVYAVAFTYLGWHLCKAERFRGRK